MPHPTQAGNLGPALDSEASSPTDVATPRSNSQSEATHSATAIGGHPVDLLAMAFIVVVTLIYFWRFIDPWAQSPIIFPPGDLTEQFYPYHHYAIAELSDGRFPIWSPYANAGQPFIGDIQTAVFYPLNLLLAYLLMTIGQPNLSFQSFEWLIVLHYIVAAAGLYVFVGRITNNRIAGLVSAMAFTFGGWLTSYPPQQTAIIQSMVWLPFALLFLRQAFFSKRRFYLLPAAGSLSLSILGGHPQTSSYLLLAAAAYALWNLLRMRSTGVPGSKPTCGNGSADMRAAPKDQRIRLASVRRYANALRWIAPLGLTFALPMVLAAEQLAPTIELWQLSRRATNDFAFTQAGFPAWQSIGLIFPAPVNAYPMYVGFFALLLALVAVLRVWQRDLLFWTLVTIATYILSFGGLTPLYALVRTIVPGYGLFRNQERVIYLTGFAIAVLAGYGAAWLLSSGPRTRRGRILLSLSPCALLAAGLVLTTPETRADLFSLDMPLSNVLRPAVYLPLVVAGAAAVLYLVSSLHTASRPRLRRASFLISGAVALLLPMLAVADNFSVNWNNLVSTQGNRLPQVPTPITQFLRREMTDGRIDHDGSIPFTGYYYRLPFLRSDAQLENRNFLNALDELGSYAAAQLFSQQYQVTRDDSPGDDLLLEWEGLRLYRLRDVPGRVSVIYRPQSVPDASEQLRVMRARIAQRDFYFDRDAVVSELATIAAFSGGGFASTKAVLDLKPTELVVQVDTSAPGLLLLADSYYPGWHAYLDGREVPIHLANSAVRGVDLPAGAHLVSFRYDPFWLRIGLAISAIGFGILLVLVARSDALARSRLFDGLPVALRATLRTGQWLVLAILLGAAPIYVSGSYALSPPTIPAALHDAERWDVARAWAGKQCSATVVSTGADPDGDQLTGSGFYPSWDAIDVQTGAAIDHVCVLANLGADSYPVQLEPPPGWQKEHDFWSGTIWGAQYVRQESILTRIPFREGGSLGSTVEVLGFGWPGARQSEDALRVSATSWPAAVQLFMRATKTTPTDYRVFVQLLDEQARAVAVSDHQPGDGARPTSTWSTNEIVVDEHQIARPRVIGSGSYQLIAGVYDEKAGSRLRGPDGQDHVVLARVQFQSP
ncbi:MAG: hypothetical protein EPO21_06995 [Chloroflexota bacterium]|nr:MAG: hypothetical protein EPO21_06995 [Chloroflexota bacterium]